MSNLSTRGKKLIGRGAFSKVWDNGDGTVMIKSTCYNKEALALFIDEDRFPKLERLDYDEVSTYTMKKYDKVRGIKKNVSAYDWELYQWLRDNLNNSTSNCTNMDDSYSNVYGIIEDMPHKFEVERDELLRVIDILCNYGSDMAFEISPRNIAIEDGTLVFLDVFFFRAQLEEIRKAA